MGRKVKALPHPEKLKFERVDPKEREPKLLALMERLRGPYEEGRRHVLLDLSCMLLNHYLPGAWVSKEWTWIVDAFQAGEISSLDKFLGLTSNKGKLRAHRWEIISAVTNLRRQGVPRQEAFKQVAEWFSAGQSTVGQIYDGHPELRTLIENLPTLQFRRRIPRFPQPPSKSSSRIPKTKARR